MANEVGEGNSLPVESRSLKSYADDPPGGGHGPNLPLASCEHPAVRVLVLTEVVRVHDLS